MAAKRGSDVARGAAHLGELPFDSLRFLVPVIETALGVVSAQLLVVMLVESLCPARAERAPPSVVVRGADFALSRSLRGMKLTLQAAVATKSAVDAELEALQAFGTRQYAARALQVPLQMRHCC